MSLKQRSLLKISFDLPMPILIQKVGIIPYNWQVIIEANEAAGLYDPICILN
jgi:hypothetical protein